MSEGSPARIDRTALERIIRRAAELQTAEREVGDTLTSEELIAVGAEVAIAGEGTTVRCPDDAVRARVVPALEAQGVPIERTDAECRSLEELFVETVAA